MPRTEDQYDAMRNATKEKIVAAGLRLFAIKGLTATSIQEIATLAGISVGLMYHYYKSKEDLFLELVETAIDSASSAVQMIFDTDQSPDTKIRTFTKNVLDEIAQSDWMSQIYLLVIHYTLAVGVPEERASEFREKGFAPLERLKRTIVEGQALGEIKPGNPDEMAMMYFATIQGLAIYKLTLGNRFVLPSPELLDSVLLKPAENMNEKSA